MHNSRQDAQTRVYERPEPRITKRAYKRLLVARQLSACRLRHINEKKAAAAAAAAEAAAQGPAGPTASAAGPALPASSVGELNKDSASSSTTTRRGKHKGKERAGGSKQTGAKSQSRSDCSGGGEELQLQQERAQFLAEHTAAQAATTAALQLECNAQAQERALAEQHIEEQAKEAGALQQQLAALLEDKHALVLRLKQALLQDGSLRRQNTATLPQSFSQLHPDVPSQGSPPCMSGQEGLHSSLSEAAFSNLPTPPTAGQAWFSSQVNTQGTSNSTPFMASREQLHSPRSNHNDQTLTLGSWQSSAAQQPGSTLPAAPSLPTVGPHSRSNSSSIPSAGHHLSPHDAGTLPHHPSNKGSTIWQHNQLQQHNWSRSPAEPSAQHHPVHQQSIHQPPADFGRRMEAQHQAGHALHGQHQDMTSPRHSYVEQPGLSTRLRYDSVGSSLHEPVADSYSQLPPHMQKPAGQTGGRYPFGRGSRETSSRGYADMQNGRVMDGGYDYLEDPGPPPKSTAAASTPRWDKGGAASASREKSGGHRRYV